MSTFMAIILGTAFGGTIYEAWKDRLGWIGAILIAIAVLGTLTSLRITGCPGSSKKFLISPLAEIWDGTKRLYTDRPLWLTVMGISYFWFLGAFLQMVLPCLEKEILQLVRHASDFSGLRRRHRCRQPRGRSFVGRQDRTGAGAAGFRRNGSILGAAFSFSAFLRFSSGLPGARRIRSRILCGPPQCPIATT